MNKLVFVYLRLGVFNQYYNAGTVELEPVKEEEDVYFVKETIIDYKNKTGSTKAAQILDEWEKVLPKFIKVYLCFSRTNCMVIVCKGFYMRISVFTGKFRQE